jgi:penicillin-binding protein 1A
VENSTSARARRALAGTNLVQTWIAFTLVFVGLLAGGFVAALLRFQGELPSTAHLERIEMPSNTRIFDRNGISLGDLFAEDRLPVRLDQVPKPLVDAVIATEDRGFYRHWGIQPTGLLRAVFANMRRGRVAQGGSTITQQLARNLFLTHERTVTRKLKEALLTIRLERIYSKDEILGMYFNHIYYGNGSYGVRSAAREYFDKELSELSLAECAFLAGIPANPTLFDPRRRFENAKGRQGVVLAMMKEVGVLDAAQADSAAKEPIVLVPRDVPSMRAPYFIEHVRQELIARYGAERLYSEGLTVTTTLDWELQEAAEKALEKQLRWLERVNHYEVERNEKWVAPEEPFVTSPYLQGAFVMIDTRTGEIVAMVGGRNYWESKFNRAVQARRQPGSTFKPFVYAAAVERGIGPSTILLDEPFVVPMPSGKDYKPENTKRDFQGPVTMRTAISKSINVPAVRMIVQIGPQAAVDVARRCGISGTLYPYPSTALGASEVTLLDITSAFAVFPNLGVLHRPWAIREVRDRDGASLERGTTTSEEAISAPVAAVMNSLLEDVMNRGTGASARSRGIHCAAGGKTGTMDDYMDAMFVGYTADYTAGAWIGFDVKTTLGRDMTGAAAALPVWIDVMKVAVDRHEPDPFEIPPGVTWRQVCSESGMAAVEDCPEPYREIFVDGQTPLEPCPMHSEERTLDARRDEQLFESLDREQRERAEGRQ